MVGNWPYGVAHKTAFKARARKNKRGTKEKEAERRPKPEASAARPGAFGSNSGSLVAAAAKAPFGAYHATESG